MQYFIHTSYGKTATTTLQDHLFGKHEEIIALARPWTADTLDLVSQLKMPNGFGFSSKAVEQKLKTIMNSKRKERVAIFSDEAFLGNPAQEIQKTLHLRLERLKAFFPGAKVIITIRNQLDMIPSYYMDSGRILRWVPEPYSNSHVTIENWIHYWLNHWEDSLFQYIDYNKVVDNYEKVFGKENVKVLMFEDFIRERESFLRQLTSYMQVNHERACELLFNAHENPSYTVSQFKYDQFKSYLPIKTNLSRFRLVRHLIERYNAPKGTIGRKAKVDIPKKYLTKFQSIYAPGNQALNVRHKLRLERYGYPI